MRAGWKERQKEVGWMIFEYTDIAELMPMPNFMLKIGFANQSAAITSLKHKGDQTRFYVLHKEKSGNLPISRMITALSGLKLSTQKHFINWASG